MPKNAQPSEEISTQKEAILRLDKVFQYINENYQNKIDLNDISKTAGLSKYYFTRFFKENVGVTFIDYLNSFRIAKSEYLLMNTNEPIIEIVYKCGFNSVKTFNRVFKNLRGSSPVAYKKAITKE
jgi:AraC-like DNA-binding protein